MQGLRLKSLLIPAAPSPQPIPRLTPHKQQQLDLPPKGRQRRQMGTLMAPLVPLQAPPLTPLQEAPLQARLQPPPLSPPLAPLQAPLQAIRAQRTLSRPGCVRVQARAVRRPTTGV